MTAPGLDAYVPALESLGQGETSRLAWARALYQQQDYAGALAECQRALAENSDSASAHCLIALCHARQEAYAPAAASCTRALELDPELVEALLLNGRLESLAGNTEAALRSYLGVLALEPDNALALRLAGDLHLDSGRVTAAIAAYEQAAAHDSTQHGTALRLAQLYLQTGASAKARDALDAANKIRITAESCLLEGQIQQAEGRLREALDAYYQAIKLDPRGLEGHLGAGELLLAMHHARLAFRQFRIALSIEPGSHRAQRGLTECQRQLGLLGGQQGPLDTGAGAPVAPAPDDRPE